MPRLTGPCAGRVRLEMLERGFTLVDTPRFFDPSQFRRFRRSWTERSLHGKRGDSLPALVRYGGWLERLLAEALPEETLALAAVEFRYEPAGYENAEVDRLHADRAYLRSVYTLYGPATLYRDGRVERPVPDGQTLLMTAQDRTRAVGLPCTLHRRPGAGPERAVIVGSFVPRRRPLPAQYRQGLGVSGRGDRHTTCRRVRSAPWAFLGRRSCRLHQSTNQLNQWPFEGGYIHIPDEELGHESIDHYQACHSPEVG
jgi:hypothetical protein